MSTLTATATNNLRTTDSLDLLTILLRPFLGSHVLQYLRWADVQRLIVTCKSCFKELQQDDRANVVKCLKDLEVLKVLNCPSPRLDKILESRRQYPTRYQVLAVPCQRTFHDPVRSVTLEHDNALEDAETHDTLEAACQNALMSWLFGDSDPIPFATIDNDSLQDILHGYGYRCNGINQAYVNMNDVLNTNSALIEETTAESGGGPSKKKMKLISHQCSSAFCQQAAASVARYFFVRQKPYCGHCLDEFFCLKLRFSYEHISWGCGCEFSALIQNMFPLTAKGRASMAV